MKELTNFDKYNMSFVNYMRQKTHNNIEKSIYNEKVRKKETYVEKFQKFILEEFKFSEEAKRRLEKIFKAIELEYKRPSKNREISERAPKWYYFSVFCKGIVLMIMCIKLSLKQIKKWVF